MKLQYDTDTFIEKASSIHNNKYNYNYAEYKNSITKIIITCPIHGNFEQTPANHLSGRGCQKCQKRAVSSKPKSKDVYLEEAAFKHNNKYSYDLTNYQSLQSKITVICPIHGDFTVTANNHLRDSGCPQCAKLKRADAHRGSKTDFINRSLAKHSNKYVYDKVEYKTARLPVVITCPIHGDFEQTPDNHLKGCGCPSCNGGIFNASKPTILYYLSINNDQAFKIGITSKSVNTRFSATDVKKIEVLFTHEFATGRLAYTVEQYLLNRFKEYSYTGLRLLESGNTELLTTNILNAITEICAKIPHNAAIDEISTILESLCSTTTK